MKKGIWKLVFWAYLMVLFLVVILKFTGSFQDLLARMQEEPYGRPYNLEPFRTIQLQWRNLNESWAQLNLLGNTLPFLPFGYLLFMSNPKKCSLLKVLLVGLMFVLLAEAVQFHTGLGTFDVDDIILNMSAIFVGYIPVGIAGIARKTKRKKKK